MKKMNWKRTVHTCYGCEYYHDENGFNNKGYNSKYCGKDHYKCPYFLGIADEAVEKWETERSKKTRQNEFLNMFPNSLKDGGVLVVRPSKTVKENTGLRRNENVQIF